ncbi:TPA: hypothetical protein ACU9KK_003263 [Legionella anisa]|nr:hypothetical protein [Legionella anisa]MCW8447368.1 hypothetical protein [Legionella anisa]
MLWIRCSSIAIKKHEFLKSAAFVGGASKKPMKKPEELKMDFSCVD